jgi:hypothetical protein
VNGLVRDLACLLGTYREEDVPLFPEVYLIPTPNTTISIAPGTQRIALGTRKLDDASARAVLKDCANLCVDGWSGAGVSSVGGF